MSKSPQWILILFLLHVPIAFAGKLQAGSAPDPQPPLILLPKYRLAPEELAIIVNDNDSLSRQIALYYRERRGIPANNIIHVRLDPDKPRLSPPEFHKLRKEVLDLTPNTVQAYALTWMKPYRVGCMSITTAFAAGFAPSWCSKKKCATTHPNPYFNSPSLKPWNRHGIRPTMSIAAHTLREAKALIDRGIASDGTWPGGTAYLVDTSDKARNVRAALYGRLVKAYSPLLRIKHIARDYIENRDDVLFYFTGLKRVPKLETLKFVPGAVADHLTSTGGVLDGRHQMSILRWLESGATGSYGTVVEPCNLPGKFPNPGILMGWYLRGETLLEAYWKSVAMPGEGIFVGEPLAAPWSGYRLEVTEADLQVITHTVRPGIYRLLVGDTPTGPFVEQPDLLWIGDGTRRVHLPNLRRAVYKLERVL